MCGRFTLHHSVEEVAQRFAVQEILFDFPARYNIAPMQPLAVVTRNASNASGDDERVLEGYRWGLVPSWAKDEAIGSRMINARAETLAEKPSFRNALKSRRCLIPADGFYEWKTEGKTKVPHYIRFRDDRIYAFAGLWEEWKGPPGTEGAPLRTATIITTDPNPLLASLHHRMAVILKPENEAAWLDPKVSAQDALQLLQTFPDDELEAFPVHRKVGNVAFDAPENIAPVGPDDPAPNDLKGQLSLL